MLIGNIPMRKQLSQSPSELFVARLRVRQTPVIEIAFVVLHHSRYGIRAP